MFITPYVPSIACTDKYFEIYTYVLIYDVHYNYSILNNSRKALTQIIKPQNRNSYDNFFSSLERLYEGTGTDRQTGRNCDVLL
jgi:hypothetical protein